MFCPQCGLEQPAGHRYCLSCGLHLPRHLIHREPKVTRWFWAVPVAPADPTHAALRVSRYLEEVEVSSPEGSVRVPADHVRFSVWVEDRAIAAISLSDGEAGRLAEFLLAHVPNGDGRREPQPA